MVELNPAVSVITLKINGPDTDWKTMIVTLDENQSPICLVEKMYFKYKNTEWKG